MNAYIPTFLSNKGTLSRGHYFGEIEYPTWPIRSGDKVAIDGKLYEVISAPAFDPLVELPKVLYHGRPLDNTPEPVVLVAAISNE